MNKKEFPLLTNNDIAYFDYAATTPMCKRAIEKWTEYQKEVGISIGRGNNSLSEKANEILYSSEKSIKNILKVSDEYELFYAKNVTEAINIIAYSIENQIKEMDIILVGSYEHHSNYLPWKYLAKRKGALFVELPTDKQGNIDYTYILRYRERIKVIAVSSVSNAFGYVCDVEQICNLISNDTMLFVDDSQLCAHNYINHNIEITAHFIPSHKVYGPKNIAIVAIKKDMLEKFQPVILGGGMVESVGYEDTWLYGRNKFMAGTIDVGSIYGMAEAYKFIQEISYETIEIMDRENGACILNMLDQYGFNVIDFQKNNASNVIAFYDEKMHAHDMNEVFIQKGVIVRTGNMCSQTALRKLEINSITRISLGLGIENNDIVRLEKALIEIKNRRNKL